MQRLQLTRLRHLLQARICVVEPFHFAHGQIQRDLPISFDVVVGDAFFQKVAQFVLDDTLVFELAQVAASVPSRESNLPLDGFGDEGV